ncbi:carboxypeptidase-like regulatory domain-containing protein [Curtobacterium flaccumfaciens]|nr:carboxypeptidase-like regulatory domain-containing protein [Curtobacterium flaccumfaciens]
MRRWRAVTAGVTGIVLGAGLAIGGATSASAATAGHWGTFTLSGSSKDYTGTMTLPGFPDTTFTSNSRQSTVVSGASTWQGPSTGPGAAYGSSRNHTYVNQRPNADSPNPASASTTTYTFADATPGGSWSFVLGDIDADQATISATVQGGGAATAADLGYQGSYNSCSSVAAGGWSCPADPGGVPAGQDTPTWDAATRTLTGNAASNDTSGATAWFSPTVSLTSLTISYQQRSGFPVYQTWFANRTAAITGTATLDGTPIPGTVVTVTAPGGEVFTTTTGSSGEYTFPELTQQAGYTVTITPPPGAQTDPATPATQTVDLVDPAGGGVDGTADFRFTSPSGTSSVIGVVTDGHNPVANVPVTITDPSAPGNPIETTTNDAGVYTGSGLPPNSTVEVSVDGGAPVTVTTGDPGTAATPPRSRRRTPSAPSTASSRSTAPPRPA